MTARRDPDRLIHRFLLEGREYLQDQVYDAVRAEIEQRRQRAVIGPWRTPIMNKFVSIGLGAAAVVVLLVVGAQLLGPRGPSGVGAAPSAAPSPTAMPSVADASASVVPGLPVGSSWELLDARGIQVNATIPAPGWFGDGGILAKNGAEAPDGAGIISFAGELFVYGDACDWSTTKPNAAAGTVDELVDALSTQAARDASAPVDVNVGGYAGKSITLHVPDDAVFSQCDEGYFGSWTDGVERTPSRYHEAPGQIDELWVIDVDGVPVVIDTTYYAGTSAGDVEELRAIVRSAAVTAH
jgi:hypothetical protein